MITANDLRRWGFKKVREGRKEITALCPFHKETESSFYINKSTGLWYCFGCGAKGNLSQLFRKLNIAAAPSRFLQEEVQDEVITTIDTSDFVPSRSPFLRRFGIMYCPSGKYAGRHAIPIAPGVFELRDFTGKMRPKVICVPAGVSLKGLVYNLNRVSPDRPLYIVEGTKDVLALISEGVSNVVSVFGAHLHQEQARVLIEKGFTKFIFAFDGDTAGLSATLQAFELLGVFDPLWVEIPKGEDPASIAQTFTSLPHKPVAANLPRIKEKLIQEVFKAKRLANPS